MASTGDPAVDAALAQQQAYNTALSKAVASGSNLGANKTYSGVLGQSPTYGATAAQLAQQKAQAAANYSTQTAQQNASTLQAAQQLGYLGGKVGSNGTISGGTWNYQNPLYAAGQAYNSVNNDFSGRGLGMSSGYTRDIGTANQQLQNQLGQLSTGNNQAITTIQGNQAAYNQQEAQALQNAQLQAIQTYQANNTLGGY